MDNVFILLFIVVTHAYMRSLYQDSQFEDLAKHRDLLWKKWRVADDALLLIGLPVLMPLFPPTWQDIALAGTVYWLAFEVLTNIVSLEQKWYYVGSSSDTDTLGYWKWVLIFGLVIISSLIKIFT